MSNMKWYMTSRTRLALALLASSLASVGLFLAGAVANRNLELAYLIYNLFLAWIPLGIAIWLERVLRTKLWSSWPALLITALWLGFLPNSFYLISDLVHLTEIPRADIVADVIMFSSFGINGLLLGYCSLFLIHQELRKRLRDRNAHMLAGIILLLSSFAIYIGRDLRWNTWDLFLNPASVIFDVSDRLLNPGANPAVITTTLGFFVLLGTLYLVVWSGARAARQQKSLK